MAGRPKKTVEIDKQAIKEKSIKEKNTNPNPNPTPLSPTNFEQENKNLRSELDELKQMILNLTQNQNQQNQQANNISTTFTTPIISNKYDDELDNFEITPNKFIKVMSLNFGKLVLTTEARGQGKTFIFNKFGDIRNIIYTDLSNIVHNHQSFAEKGRFYIFDKNFVRNHGLSGYYNKFLNKETIDNILNYNSDEIISLFKNTTDVQRDIIVNLLIKKIVDGEEVDVIKVDVLSRLGKVNIYDVAREKISQKEKSELM